MVFQNTAESRGTGGLHGADMAVCSAGRSADSCGEPCAAPRTCAAAARATVRKNALRRDVWEQARADQQHLEGAAHAPLPGPGRAGRLGVVLEGRIHALRPGSVLVVAGATSAHRHNRCADADSQPSGGGDLPRRGT